jgi:hypothetical protein
MFVNVSYTHLVIVVTLLATIIAALLSVWRSTGMGIGERIVWTAVVVLVPYLGPLLWAITLAVSRRRAAPHGA